MTRTILILVMAAMLAANAAAQGTVPLETILNEAARQVQNYRTTFIDLIAEETKLFTEYDDDGGVSERTGVKSDFLVYRSGKDAGFPAELRNVREVDGKPVPDSAARSERFLAELEKTETPEKVLRKIEREGTRFDRTWEIGGLTLNQAVALAPNLRPLFEFRLKGREMIGGGEAYLIEYRQTQKSPFITLNGKDQTGKDLTLNFRLDVPGGLKKEDALLRGRLWIDTRTFQLHREERELTVGTTDPVVLLAGSFEYTPSDYGLLVPKTIGMTVFRARSSKEGPRYTAEREATVRFDYSKFRKTDVEVRILDEPGS